MPHTRITIERMTEEAARDCRDAVLREVRRRARSMSLAETKGYARAMAGLPVRRRVEEMLDRTESLPTRARGILMRNATERTVEMVVRSLITRPQANSRRRAA